MSRRRGCFWFSAGLVLAVVAGVLAYMGIQRATAPLKPVEEPPRVQVLTAARDIALHTVITEADVVLRQVPPDMVPEDGLSDVAEAVGKLSVVTMARGEIILRRRLMAPDYVGPNAALVMDPQQVIIALPAHDLLSGIDIIRPGDHVDLMFSYDFGKGSPEVTTGMNTFTALQDLRVAALVRGPGSEQQQSAGKGPVRAILLAVSPQDALTIKYFQDAGAAPDLALRSPAASGPFDVTPVDGSFVLERYKIRWQPKK